MHRAEFSKATKREALARSGGFCEAVGSSYGLNKGQRCGAALRCGVEFDHAILEANSHDNSLSNCISACIKCHRWKTRHIDIPKAAKTLRQQDKHNGIANHKRKWASRNSFKRQDSNCKDINT